MPVAVTELEPGMVRVTLPLPWALDHVHCYAIAAGEGWTLIDSGLGGDATIRWWEEALADLGRPPVARIVITHYHPDHVGAGAALAELTGAREVVQGRLDAELTRLAWGEGADTDAFAEYLRGHGMPAEDAAHSAEAEQDTPVRFPHPTRLVEAGDSVWIGEERYAVHLLPGHADGHIALHGQTGGRLFGGDVLLDEITPNVGRWPDTAPDPLGAYLRTLDAIDDLAPAIVYPGHGPSIGDASRRTAEIRAHHRERLDAHRHALEQGAETAHEVAQLVWADEGLGFHEQRFALVESISHLERLLAEGRARRPAPGRWSPGAG